MLQRTTKLLISSFNWRFAFFFCFLFFDWFVLLNKYFIWVVRRKNMISYFVFLVVGTNYKTSSSEKRKLNFVKVWNKRRTKLCFCFLSQNLHFYETWQFLIKIWNPFKNNKKTPQKNQNPSFSLFLCFFVLGGVSLVLFFCIIFLFDEFEWEKYDGGGGGGGGWGKREDWEKRRRGEEEEKRRRRERERKTKKWSD